MTEKSDRREHTRNREGRSLRGFCMDPVQPEASGEVSLLMKGADDE